MRWNTILVALVLAACGREATLVTATCGDEPCPSCATDAACIVLHNPCQEVAACGHVDAPIAVTMEGCDPFLEYATPPDERCVCEVDACVATP